MVTTLPEAEKTPTRDSVAAPEVEEDVKPRKGLGKIGNIFACGTALFSDGYQNGVSGDVNYILSTLYPDQWSRTVSDTFTSVIFAGTVAGMLIFGFLADEIGRKFGMVLATLIVAVFAALSAGSYFGGSVKGMFHMLAAWRFFIGIGIGAEYPAGSVACSENTEDPGVKKGTQHGLFALATNSAIDWGFVASTFVPYVFLLICGGDHLRAVWRLSLGFGVVPPLLVLIWRLQMNEPVRFRKEAMTHANTPYRLIIKKYWVRWTGLAIAWFIYDFITYPFGIYSSTIVAEVIGSNPPLVQTFGWNIVINLFYIPGTMLGALLVDRVSPKRLMCCMLICQAIFGFAMSGAYQTFQKHVGGFAVMYGLFLSFGEAGPGNCLGLLASKSSPTAFRGKFYGLAAAVGKIGAFVGTWSFRQIEADFGSGAKASTGPFYVGSGLAILSAIITFTFVPEVPNGYLEYSDMEFREYLAANGYDVTRIGMHAESRLENMFAPGKGPQTLEASKVDSRVATSRVEPVEEEAASAKQTETEKETV